MAADGSGQSVVEGRQGRADQGDGEDELVSCSNVSTGDESAGGQSASRTSRGRRRVRWTASTSSPIPRRRKAALFVRLSRGWIFDHVREVVLRQRGETTSRLDADETDSRQTESSPSTGWRETARRMGVTPGRQTCDTGACDERGHRVRVLDGSGRLVREGWRCDECERQTLGVSS